MRLRYASTNWRQVILPERIAWWISAIVISDGSNFFWDCSGFCQAKAGIIAAVSASGAINRKDLREVSIIDALLISSKSVQTLSVVAQINHEAIHNVIKHAFIGVIPLHPKLHPWAG